MSPAPVTKASLREPNLRRAWVGASIIALVLLVLLFNRGTDELNIRVGDPFPDIVLEDLDSKQHHLSDYRGSLVLLNVWATWCEPCRNEMPALQGLQERFESRGLKVIGLSIDDDLNLVREFNRRYELDFSRFVDQGQAQINTLGVNVFPYSFIISSEGVLLDAISGEQDWLSEAMLEQFMARWLLNK